MIRVNLLGERRSVKKRFAFGTHQKMVVGCGIILVVTGAGLGWRIWSLNHASAAVDAELSAAQKETARLHSIIAQVQQFEQRRAQLQQRVGLIEQLRRDQIGPVHMLDEISRALPPMMWLTGLKQNKETSDVIIDGRCTTLTGLSDFVANLQASGYFRRSVEILNSSTENSKETGELIHFQIKASFEPPDPGKAPDAAAPSHSAQNGA